GTRNLSENPGDELRGFRVSIPFVAQHLVCGDPGHKVRGYGRRLVAVAAGAAVEAATATVAGAASAVEVAARSAVVASTVPAAESAAARAAGLAAALVAGDLDVDGAALDGGRVDGIDHLFVHLGGDVHERVGVVDVDGSDGAAG